MLGSSFRCRRAEVVTFEQNGAQLIVDEAHTDAALGFRRMWLVLLALCCGRQTRFEVKREERMSYIEGAWPLSQSVIVGLATPQQAHSQGSGQCQTQPLFKRAVCQLRYRRRPPLTSAGLSEPCFTLGRDGDHGVDQRRMVSESTRMPEAPRTRRLRGTRSSSRRPR